MGGGAREVHSIEIPLVHVQQHLSWDCGVSAVMMVLKEKDRLYMQNNLDTVSKEEGFNKSTWTIDLAYLLHKFGVSHLYATVTLGVNPGYSEEDFYIHVLKKDAQRINEKFHTADHRGVKVEKRSVEMEEILNHLGSGNPAIVLVNANLLFCDTCHAPATQVIILSYVDLINEIGRFCTGILLFLIKCARCLMIPLSVLAKALVLMKTYFSFSSNPDIVP